MNKCNAGMHEESMLRCGKCGDLICPSCAVQTPVGFRCRECANLDKLPTFRVGTKHYVIAAAVGLVLAVVFGLVWSFIMGTMPYLYLNLVIAPGIGALMAEIISRSVNRKRGMGLAIVAGGSMLVCYLIEIFSPLSGGFYFYDLVGLGLSIATAAGILR